MSTDIRELKKTTTATGTGTSPLNKRFNEENKFDNDKRSKLPKSIPSFVGKIQIQLSIICSEKRRVLRELSSKKTVRKCPSIFLRQMVVIVFIILQVFFFFLQHVQFWKLGISPVQLFPRHHTKRGFNYRINIRRGFNYSISISTRRARSFILSSCVK